MQRQALRGIANLMTHDPTDPVDLTAALVRCASVTPLDEGALGVLDDALTKAGFHCTRVERGGINNLFARWGDKTHPQTFGFNGHTDVVPVGDEAVSYTHLTLPTILLV